MTQAFVLGAGLGTRLRPLTETTPKPLVPIFQKPLITFALDHLIANGLRAFVINTHHLGEQLSTFFASGSYRDCAVRVVHEPLLLDTGGGIKNVEQWITTEPFVVYSGDILTDFDLRPLIDEHMRTGNDVTLALRKTGLASGVAFQNGRVTAIQKRPVPDGYDFANVSIWNRSVFERIPANEKISFIPILVEWINSGGKIGGVVMNDGLWFNIGSPAEYLHVHHTIIDGPWRPRYVSQADWPLRISPNAAIDSTAQLAGYFSIAENVTIGAGAYVENTIVWAGAQIASRTRLRNCIVRADQTAEGDLSDAII